MNNIKVYLCDLFHNQFSSREDWGYSVPLNIGYIGAYLKEKLDKTIDLSLFKYPDKLIRTLKNNMPNIIGLSCYSWNQELVLHIARKVKQISPEVLVVLGGPNIDTTEDYLNEFLKNNNFVDYYIPFDGEEIFLSLIENYLSVNNLNKLKSKKILGAATYLGGLNYPERKRAEQFSKLNYPSPYLSGLLDEFIKDPFLAPIFETNRGCPYSCTYCTWGVSLRNRMRKWPLERILDEFEYVYKNGAHQQTWLFADGNFGIYKRDVKIAQKIAEISQRPDGFNSLLLCNSKNNVERNIKIAEILGHMDTCMVAFQTLDDHVLKLIKRQNIKKQDMIGVLDYLKTKNVDIKTHILVGLPGETYSSHLNTLRKCIDYDIDWIGIMNTMLLAGSELASKESRAKYGLQEKYRLNKDSYGYYWDEWIIDPEETIQSTNTMNEKMMLMTRPIHFFVWLFWNIGILKPILLAAKLYGINPIDIFVDILKNGKDISNELYVLLRNYNNETAAELFNTKEELCQYYLDQDDIGKALTTFEYLNFKYIPKILLGPNIFTKIIEHIVSYIKAKNSSHYNQLDLQEIKKFTMERLCLDLNNIEGVREIVLSKKTVNFLVNHRLIQRINKKAKIIGDKRYIVKLKLNNKELLISSCIKNKINDDTKDYQNLFRSKDFIQHIIYKA